MTSRSTKNQSKTPTPAPASNAAASIALAVGVVKDAFRKTTLATQPIPVPANQVVAQLGIAIPKGFSVTRGRTDVRRCQYFHAVAQEYETSDDSGTSQVDQMREFVSLRKMAVAILPMCPNEGKYLLIRQFRYPAFENSGNPNISNGSFYGDPREDGWLYEAIAGVIEPGDSPEETAIREAEEEGNVIIAEKDIRKTNHCFMTPGLTNEEMHIFLAVVDKTTDGTATTGLKSESELIRAKWMTAEEIRQLHTAGLLRDAKTLLALYAARVL